MLHFWHVLITRSRQRTDIAQNIADLIAHTTDVEMKVSKVSRV